MLQFIVGGYHQRLLQRKVSINLEIDLVFSIFVLSNGEVSWSMRAFHLQTSYDSLSLPFVQNWNSICTRILSALHFHLCFHFCCNILDFANLSFPFFYISSMMKNGLTCPLAILLKLCITFYCSSQEKVALCPNVNNDSHHPNHVNFSHPRVIVIAVEPNVMDDLHI
jgi:hypothetical protein